MKLFQLIVLLLLSLAQSKVHAVERLILGANFNENMHAARVPVLDSANARWIRGFLPALEFVDGDRVLEKDSELAAFREAAKAGYKTVLSLKWDFRKSNSRVPEPGSAREQALLDWALDVVHIGKPDLLCLVNEVSIDTMPVDMQLDNESVIPMVRFLERLASHVRAASLKTSVGEDLPLSCGGFTQLSTRKMQRDPAVLALLNWLSATPDVDMVNYHLHHRTVAEFEQSLEYARQQVPTKPLVITEFSRVWAYGDHSDSPIGKTESGKTFAQLYNRDAQMTVREYLNSLYRHPVPEAEYEAFLASQPWFDPQFLEQACVAMEKRGVVLATYAFVQEASGGRGPIRPGQPLWGVNPIFADRMTVPSTEIRPGKTIGFYETFVMRQRDDLTLDIAAPNDAR